MNKNQTPIGHVDFSKGITVDSAKVTFSEAAKLIDAMKKHDDQLEVRIDLYGHPSSLLSIKEKK